ncbi:MAG: hypothetical protein IJJ26_07355 [Victivallales bacterium]|nr:hypothetical protein [Victivallales bacterium]
MNTVADFQYSVKNPDSVTRSVTLTLLPKNNSTAIYTKLVEVPPKSLISGSVPVFIPSTDSCVVQLQMNGNIIGKDSLLLWNAFTNKFEMAVFHDEIKISINPMRVIHKDVFPYLASYCPFQSSSAPTNWAELERFAMVVLTDVNWNQMTYPKQLALRDYVLHGGTIVLASPSNQMDMEKSLLAPLSPWIPEDLVKLDDFTSVCKAFDVPPRTILENNSVPLCLDALQTLVKPEGIVLREADGVPYAAMSRHGEGRVIALAVNPFSLLDGEKAFQPAIWNMIAFLTGYRNLIMQLYEPDPINSTMQQLQGYSIPGIGTIRSLLLLYLIGSAIIIIVMFRLRRHAAGWLLVCLFGLLLTCFVMYQSKHVVKGQSPFNMTTIVQNTYEDGFGGERTDAMLVAQSDCRPVVKANEARVFFSPQFPRPTLVGLENKGHEVVTASPLWFQADRNSFGTHNMLLQQMKPRSFRLLTAMQDFGKAPFKQPIIRVTTDGRAIFPEWEVPQWYGAPSHAILVLPGKLTPLSVSARTVTESRTNAVATDTVFNDILDILRKKPHLNPGIFLLRINRKSSEIISATNDDTPFSSYQYEITFFPAKLDIPDKLSELSSDFLRWHTPDSSQIRSIYRNGDWAETSLNFLGDYKYQIDYEIPPELKHHKPAKFIFDVRLADSSNSIKVNGFLLTKDNERISPQIEGTRLIFDLAGKEILRDGGCSFPVHLLLSPKERNSNNLETTRISNWKIQSLTATIHYQDSSND